VVIYSGTPAGIAASVTLRREYRSVVPACRDGWIGGLSTNWPGYAEAGGHAAAAADRAGAVKVEGAADDDL